ncbi:MAG TPA: 50S ribosomal protein L23 [Actinobacteria bacterium]|nr:50S ribosomal protein L23 [Actinomycetota bacterium]
MSDPNKIIIRPVISEKSYDFIEKGKYVFEVHPDAKKIDISRAVENIFNVVVTKVNTMFVKGKIKKQGRTFGRTKNWKKAVVTLREGDRIEFFEGK